MPPPRKSARLIGSISPRNSESWNINRIFPTFEPMAEENLKIGRPAKYETPQLLQAAIDLYFQTCKSANEYPTITMLAYELGFESRQSFYDYEGKSEEFSYIIKRARLLVEFGYEKQLQGERPTGAIFALKNMGWKDTQAVDHTSNGESIQPSINVFTSTPAPDKLGDLETKD